MAAMLTAEEICAYDNAKLCRYLEENGHVVRVSDPQNLPKSFIDRLKEFYGGPNTPPGAAASHPIDLDQVNAKLLQMVEGERPGLTPSPSPELWLNHDEKVARYAQLEQGAYDKLVGDGAHPLYDQSQIHAVCDEPYSYKDLLVPYTDPIKHPMQDWFIALQMQWEHWTRFRWTQGIKRKTDAKLEAHNKLAKENRDELGITEEIVFIKEADKQNKLTTWMEYLQFECTAFTRQGYLMRHALMYKKRGPRLIKWIVEQIPTVKKDSEAEASNDATGSNAVDSVDAADTASNEQEGEPARSHVESPSMEEVVERNIKDGTRAYEALVAKGGRPLHPIEDLRIIAEDPDAYPNIWRPFPLQRRIHDSEWWCKFGAQLVSWEKFLEYRDRGRRDEDTLDALNKKAVVTRALVGATRPVVFLMDMDKQDKLTTWLEYLQHECDYYELWYKSLKHFDRQRKRPILQTINWIIEQIPLIEAEMLAEVDGSKGPKNNTAEVAVVEEAAQEALQQLPPLPAASASRKRKRDDDEDDVAIAENREIREPAPKRRRTEMASAAAAVSVPAVPLPPPAMGPAPQQVAPRRSARLAEKAAKKAVEAAVVAAKPPVRAKAKTKTRTKTKSGAEEKPARLSRRQAVSKPQKKTTAKAKK